VARGELARDCVEGCGRNRALELVLDKEGRSGGVPAAVTAAGGRVGAQVAWVIGGAAQGTRLLVEAIDKDGRETEVACDHPPVGRVSYDAVGVRRLLAVVQLGGDPVAALRVGVWIRDATNAHTKTVPPPC